MSVEKAVGTRIGRLRRLETKFLNELLMPSVPSLGPDRTLAAPSSTPQTVTASAPPHPLDGEWMMLVDGQEYGPFTGRQLEGFAAEGRIEPQSEVRRMAGGNWIAARADTTLRDFFPDQNKPPLVAPRRNGRGTDQPPLTAGDRSTVVQVTNTIQQPAFIPADLAADKSPALALLLSLLFVGAGQLYNGDVGKGILMFFGCILLWIVMLGWIINIWSMIDAYSKAKSLRDRHRAYFASLAGARAA